MKTDKEKQITEELTTLLKQISKDQDFLDGVLGMANRSYEQEEVIEYIKAGEDVSYENLLLLALSIRQRRKKQ